MGEHDHGASGERERARHRLALALGLSAGFLVVEVGGALLAGSLALLAEATHLFADVAALLLAYAAMRLADRSPTRRYSFGFDRAEILAAFVNGQILLVLSAFLFLAAYRRFAAPPPRDTGLMMLVAAASLSVNLLAAGLLHRHHSTSLNVRAAYLEVLSDALGSVGVLSAAAAMRITEAWWLDPATSVAVGFLVVPRTLAVLRQSAHILLEGTPREVDVAEVRQLLLTVPGVEELHDLHVWTLSSGRHSASLHIRAAEWSPRGEVLQRVQRLLKNAAGIDHATVQVEWGRDVSCEARDHD